MEMPENISHFEFLLVAGSLIGGWVKFHSDYSRLSARVAALEADSGEFREDVRQMMKDIQEIKILLAKNQVQ